MKWPSGKVIDLVEVEKQNDLCIITNIWEASAVKEEISGTEL
jgi:hypothetical protein